MLVLSRKVNECIVISDEIVLTIIKLSGNRVTVGIEAPQEVSIRRGELTANADATQATSPIVAKLGR